jgi:hypothetical protein
MSFSYLAPMTIVLLRRTNFSNSVYMPPGIVPNAAQCQSYAPTYHGDDCLRPVNSASVTNVPNSDSKRSRRGVTARRLKIMWKKLRCINGKRLSRCTAQVRWSAFVVLYGHGRVLENSKGCLDAPAHLHAFDVSRKLQERWASSWRTKTKYSHFRAQTFQTSHLLCITRIPPTLSKIHLSRLQPRKLP